MTVRLLPLRRLIAALFGTLKLTQMYGRRHDTTAEALRNLAECLKAAMEEGEVRISVRGKRLQVNNHPMRARECGTLALGFLVAEWSKRGIEMVRFRESAGIADLEVFAATFLDLDVTRPEPAERLITALAAGGCHGIAVERSMEEAREPILMEEQRESAMRTYLRGLKAFKEVLRCGGIHDRVRQRAARRAVQGIVDSFLEDESAVLALAQIRSYDLKLFHHSLNVCVYALLIGHRLDMSRRQLGELGLAALFHDLGKTVARADETPEAARLAHPGRGARLLLVEGTSHEGMLKAAIAAYEHHVHYDGRGGYPAVDHSPHLVSRIVAIADAFESLATSHAPGPGATPWKALRLLQERAGTQFDPVLLRLFANALGVYPVGSVVELTSGEVAIVAEGPAQEDRLDCPRVRIVDTAEGELEAGVLVDLTDCHETGVPLRQILRTLPAEEIFSDAGEHAAAL